MKKQIARLALRWVLPRFLRDPDAFHRLLGEAIRLQFGEITDDEFRRALDHFYGAVDRSALMAAIDFEAKAKLLDLPNGYKVPVASWRSAETGGWPPSRSIWRRRFGLLNHLGIRSDVLILREGTQIPPHGHHRVVSGFYVLLGNVAVRHYERIRETSQGLVVRKALDTILGPGGYTTNSEHHHNIHWLAGLAPASYLFRLTIAGMPVLPFSNPTGTSERVYLDPSGPPNEDGLIAAPYISESAAKELSFAHIPSC